MTRHELKLLDMGARLYARQVLARAALREEQAQRERQWEEQAKAFWEGVSVADVLRWPGRGSQ